MSGASGLWRAALKLGRGGRRRKGLPPLLLFTDPDRTPDPVRIAARLPRGAGVVFRPFDRPEALAQGPALRRLCARRRLVFLVGADARLAARLRADGVHFPQRLAGRRGEIRRLPRRWIVTAAAHDIPAVLRERRCGFAALVISPVFASASPSAGRPIGPQHLAAMVRAARLSVYALGGIKAGNVARLGLAGVAGVAAVDALACPGKSGPARRTGGSRT